MKINAYITNNFYSLIESKTHTRFASQRGIFSESYIL
jgi:hypothetical protein